jgi:hypothetical protein
VAGDVNAFWWRSRTTPVSGFRLRTVFRAKNRSALRKGDPDRASVNTGFDGNPPVGVQKRIKEGFYWLFFTLEDVVTSELTQKEKRIRSLSAI